MLKGRGTAIEPFAEGLRTAGYRILNEDLAHELDVDLVLGHAGQIGAEHKLVAALNQIHGPKEILPMIESEHDNLTPQKGRACPARTREILDEIVKGGEFHPDETRQ